MLNLTVPASVAVLKHILVRPVWKALQWQLCGVVANMSDLRLAVVGSNPGHGIAVVSEVGDRFFRVDYLGM